MAKRKKTSAARKSAKRSARVASKRAVKRVASTRAARAPESETAVSKGTPRSRAKASKSALRQTPRISKPETLRALYPAIDAYNSGYLNVGNGHEIYFEESG